MLNRRADPEAGGPSILIDEDFMEADRLDYRPVELMGRIDILDGELDMVEHGNVPGRYRRFAVLP